MNTQTQTRLVLDFSNGANIRGADRTASVVMPYCADPRAYLSAWRNVVLPLAPSIQEAVDNNASVLVLLDERMHVEGVLALCAHWMSTFGFIPTIGRCDWKDREPQLLDVAGMFSAAGLQLIRK